MLNSTGSNSDPLETLLITCLDLDIEAYHSLSVIIKPIPFPLDGPPIKAMSSQFVPKCCWGQCQKLCTSPGKQLLFPHPPVLLFPCPSVLLHHQRRSPHLSGMICSGWNHQSILCFSCALAVSRRIYSIILPGTELRPTGLYFPGLTSFPFWKMVVLFLLFQSVGTSADCHDNELFDLVIWLIIHSGFCFKELLPAWSFEYVACFIMFPETFPKWISSSVIPSKKYFFLSSLYEETPP